MEAHEAARIEPVREERTRVLTKVALLEDRPARQVARVGAARAALPVAAIERYVPRRMLEHRTQLDVAPARPVRFRPRLAVACLGDEPFGLEAVALGVQSIAMNARGRAMHPVW